MSSTATVSFAKVRALYLSIYRRPMPEDLPYETAAKMMFLDVFHGDGPQMERVAERLYCPSYPERGGHLLHAWDAGRCIRCRRPVTHGY
jgi:hypothetical protein